LDVRTLVNVLALLLAAIGCASDLRARRIPNSIVLAGFVAGLTVNALIGGVTGVGSSLAGGAIGLALFLPFFVLGGMGGGDVKLMAALGSLVGPRDVVRLALAAAVVGGCFALVVAARNRRLRDVFRSTARLFAFWARSGLAPSPEQTLENPAALRIPYAVPILLGTLLVALGPVR
jgi:prepilin peptidase CpaA